MAVELVRLKPGDPVPMEMIDRSANQLNDQINDIIWNMNEKNDDLRNLCDYIFRFASKFLQEASITLSIYEDIPEDKIPVTGQDRRRIYLCVKELINNIVNMRLLPGLSLMFLTRQICFTSASTTMVLGLTVVTRIQQDRVTV